MTEWLGNGLQNRVQQFESAWHLKIKRSFNAKFLLLYAIYSKAVFVKTFPVRFSLHKNEI